MQVWPPGFPGSGFRIKASRVTTTAGSWLARLGRIGPAPCCQIFIRQRGGTRTASSYRLEKSILQDQVAVQTSRPQSILSRVVNPADVVRRCTYIFYLYMSSHLKVLVGDLYKSGHCMYISAFRGSRKCCDDIREKKVMVSRKFCVTHVVKISVFRKSLVQFRERSAIVPR